MRRKPRRPDIPLKDVLGELRLKILSKQRIDDGTEKGWLFLIGKENLATRVFDTLLPFKNKDSSPFPEPPKQKRCIPVLADSENNPHIYEEEADAIRRRFLDDDKEEDSGFTQLKL